MCHVSLCLSTGLDGRDLLSCQTVCVHSCEGWLNRFHVREPNPCGMNTAPAIVCRSVCFSIFVFILFVSLSVVASTCRFLSVCLLFYLSVSLSVIPSVCLLFHLPVWFSVFHFIHLSAILSHRMSLCLPFHLSVCLCLSICLSAISSIHLFFLSARWNINLPDTPPVCLSICLSVTDILSTCLSL